MIFDVQISRQAEQDIRDIYEYIAFELLAPENALSQLERLEKAILELDHMAERFRRYEKEPWHSRGLRVFPVDNYLVFYIPDAEKKTVTVTRVMYGGRNTECESKRHTDNKK